MFLQTVVLLLQLPAGGSSLDYDDPIPITYEDFTLRTTEYINSVRQVVANGQVVKSKWGSVNPPTSKHMFRLKWSPEMETYAGINVQGCQSSNSIPSGGSLSFNTIQLSGDTASDSLSTTNKFSRVMPQDFNYTKGTLTLFNEVLWNWTDPLYYNLTDGQGQVIYSDKTMEPFANMMYYKATEVGCAVQICNNIFATACVFNKAPQWGEPIYIANPNSNGCSTNEDCSSIKKGYVCLTSGFRQGLCTYPDDTTTSRTTTTPTTPAPGRSAPSEATPTSGTGKTTLAAGSTKSTGPTKETEPSSTVATTTSQSDYIIKLINEMRAKVAAGDISTLYGPLPSSLHMFQLEYSPELEVYAKINTIQCQTQNYTPPGSSMSYYMSYETPSDNLSNITVIKLALASWMQEILNTNFGSQFTYTNQNMKNFANMIYYKSTKAGCSYQSCSNLTSPVAVVACVFDSAPQLGKPIYPSTQGVNGCNKDSDCSAVIFGTTCGPRGLCGYSFSHTTVSIN
ncbi:hypothetical protein V3C99_006245 [Haemonchus contortus]